MRDQLAAPADELQTPSTAQGSTTPGKSPLIVQRAAGGAAPSDPAVVQPIAEQGVASGGGAIPFKDQMESGFGASFDSVSFHSGGAATAASSAIGAEAYTMGSSIAMASTPTPHLVAHELAHVVQQNAGVGPSSGVGTAGDAFEQEADHAAHTVASGGQSDLVSRYGDFSAGMGGAIQRKTVQRYESGEHALLGAGPNYPVGAGDLVLPSGAQVFSGELVAFGDFYSDMVQLQQAPRQEIEALAGICRLEAVWYQARRLAAQGHGTPQDGVASLVAGQSASGSGGNTGGAPPAVANAAAHSPTGPSAAHLTTLPRIEGNNPVWADATATVGSTGVTVAMCRQQIFNQFSAVWAAFNIHFDINTLPETGVGILRATIGRRRFRGTNDVNTRDDDQAHAPRPNEHEGPGRDPGHLGGDYLDLAQNNLSHFSPDNMAHWQDQHEHACSSYAGAHDDATRNMALATDNFGSHFLTDRFSTGHFVDKAELMTYATSMMVSTARAPGRIAGSGQMSDNEVLRVELSNAVNACFSDPNVMHQWEAGVNEAVENHTVTGTEGTIMRNLPHGQVASMITGVLMESPWRTYSQGATPIEPENAGPDAGGRSALDRSRGQGPLSQDSSSAQANGGAYQLGVGNLAALQVHDALNAIGFTVENGRGQRWRCQGDDHLQQQTMDIANACVVASQSQVRAGQSRPDEIKSYVPRTAWMDPAWIADYFKGQWGNAELDDGRIAALQQKVTGARIDLNVDGGHRTETSDLMTQICHDLMRILFMPRPTGPTSHEGDHNTGLNISMLKAFLIRRLGDMVSMAYAAASAADIPQSALELYAPRDTAGHTLPRAAHNFTWPSADTVSFDLNTTGCAPGPYMIGVRCFNRDNDYDVEASGMPGYGLVDSQTRGHGLDDTDTEYSHFPFPVTVPASATPNDPDHPQTVRVTVPVPRHGDNAASRFFHDQGDRYIVVTGDPAGACNIGRSNIRAESMFVPTNPAPAGGMPKATGGDATSSPDRDPNAAPQIRDDRAQWTPPMRVHNGQFTWHDGAVSFRIEADSPSPSDRQLAMNIETIEHNWIMPDEFLSLTGSQAHFGQNQTVSDVVTFFPRGDTPYIKIWQNGRVIGESRREGHDSGHGDRAAAPVVGVQRVSNFVWNGNLLRFQVEPESATEVFVKFVNSFEASDLAASAFGATQGLGGYGVQRVRITNGWGAADSSQIPHNVTGHVYRDEACDQEVGESSARR